MTRRDNRGSRVLTNLPRRRRILVFCGGRRTEPDYFEGLRKSSSVGFVALEIRQKGVSPSDLVDATSDYVRLHPDTHDEVWCVLDVDTYVDVAVAARMAAKSGFSVAISNPCFELWLLLHHTDRRAAARDCRDLLIHLRKFLPSYDKTDIRFRDYETTIRDAVARARTLEDPNAALPPNPSTGVWRIVENMLKPAPENT